MELRPPAPADIETGVTHSTDIVSAELGSPQDGAPVIVVIPTAHDANELGTPAEHQLNSELTQHSYASGVATLAEASSHAPVCNQ